jgi:rhomboid protease GluP
MENMGNQEMMDDRQPLVDRIRGEVDEDPRQRAERDK